MITSSGHPPPAYLLPAVVVGGYLGAGKTTLVNHLLRQSAAARDGPGKGGGEALRIAVLLNDFGDIGIDAALIEGAEGPVGSVLNLAGGCVCCSYGGSGPDLVSTLMQLARRTPRPDVALIEASGIALPAAVARAAALAPGVWVQGSVVVADATRLREQAGAPYVGDTVRQQLHEADLLVLGKADLVPGAHWPAVAAWLREQQVRAPCVRATHGAVPSELVFGLQQIAPHWPANRAASLDALDAPDVPDASRTVATGGTAGAGCSHTGPTWAPRALRATNPPLAATHHYEAATEHLPGPVDVAALGRSLVDRGVLRAKGLLQDVSGAWLELQVAAGRVHVRQRTATSPAARAAAGALVTLALRER